MWRSVDVTLYPVLDNDVASSSTTCKHGMEILAGYGQTSQGHAKRRDKDSLNSGTEHLVDLENVRDSCQSCGIDDHQRLSYVSLDWIPFSWNGLAGLRRHQPRRHGPFVSHHAATLSCSSSVGYVLRTSRLFEVNNTEPRTNELCGESDTQE